MDKIDRIIIDRVGYDAVRMGRTFNPLAEDEIRRLLAEAKAKSIPVLVREQDGTLTPA